jgi:hypothetical protein
VDQFYQAYLRRAADAAGRAFWVRQLLAGLGEAGVVQGLLSSAEYAATHPTPAAFVASLYADMLGRVGDVGGSAGWVSLLSAEASRAQVAHGFLASAEVQRRTVDQYYETFLHRQADADGESGWVTALIKRRLTTTQVAEAILASEEFFARAASGM